MMSHNDTDDPECQCDESDEPCDECYNTRDYDTDGCCCCAVSRPPCSFCEDGGTTDSRGRSYLPRRTPIVVQPAEQLAISSQAASTAARPPAPIRVFQSRIGFGWWYRHTNDRCQHSASFASAAEAGDAGRRHLSVCKAAQ